MEHNQVCRMFFGFRYYDLFSIDVLVQEQLSSSSQNEPTIVQAIPAVPEPVKMEVVTEEVKKEEEIKTESTIIVNNPCVICGKEEKRLACIPCGHLVSCSNCSSTLRTCPVCRRSIEAFVRIFI